MKKLTVLLFIIWIGIPVFAGGRNDMKGDGNLVSLEIPVSSFDTIRVSGHATVYYHESLNYRAVLTIDANLTEYISISTRGSSLEIRTKRDFF